MRLIAVCDSVAKARRGRISASSSPFRVPSRIAPDVPEFNRLTCIHVLHIVPSKWEKMADCGSDCFACHPIAKIEGSRVAEHTVIRECRDCHMKLKTKVELDVSPKGQSVMPTLRDFLKP